MNVAIKTDKVRTGEVVIIDDYYHFIESYDDEIVNMPLFTDIIYCSDAAHIKKKFTIV